MQSSMRSTIIEQLTVNGGQQEHKPVGSARSGKVLSRTSAAGPSAHIKADLASNGIATSREPVILGYSTPTNCRMTQLLNWARALRPDLYRNYMKSDQEFFYRASKAQGGKKITEGGNHLISAFKTLESAFIAAHS